MRKERQTDADFPYHRYRGGGNGLDGPEFARTLNAKQSHQFKDVIRVSSHRLNAPTWEFHTVATTDLLDKIRANSMSLSEGNSCDFSRHRVW